MQDFELRLQKAGLTGNEAKVYYELLRKGSLIANELAKKISMDRTLVYTVLNHLTEKGLVNYVIKNNKKYFEANDPSNLLNPLKEKEAMIRDLIPELNKLEKIKESSQQINVYEGIEGLRTYMNLFMKNKTFVAFGATGRLYDYLYEAPRLAKEMERKGFSCKIITNSKYKNHAMTNYKKVETRFLDIESEATTTISGDFVGICLIKEKPLVIVIKNKEIADSYRNYFEVMWNSATKMKLMDKILTKSKFTESDALNLGRKVNNAIAKKHGLK